mmetsp:Transcript_24956/g.62249  ORF Transcript_24956/g.62249 Transcript_24956/m.62249 type:complete len:459 (-) Transcript_24956:196-1572(-)
MQLSVTLSDLTGQYRVGVCVLVFGAHHLHVVRRSAVLGRVQARRLLLRGSAQHANRAEGTEEEAKERAGPGDDDDDAGDLARQQVARAAVKHAILLEAVRLLDVPLRGEEANEQHPPHTAHAVHGEGLQGVVDAQLEQELAGTPDDKGATNAGEDGGVGLHHGAPSGDGYQPSQDPVAHGDEVPHVVQEVVDEHGGEATRGGGHGGAHGGAPHHRHGISANDGQHRSRVEAVPPHPQDEGAEHDEGGVVAGHGDGPAVGSEAAGARAHDHGAHESGKATHHVHHARARKVNHAHFQQLFVVAIRVVFLEGGEPAVGVPDPVHDGGVHKGGEEEGVSEVRLEGSALGDGAGDNGGRGGREGPLEQERVPVTEPHVVVTLAQCERAFADERVGLAIFILSVGHAIAEEVEGDGPDARVEDVLDEDVHHVLGADRAGAEHGETSLHEEDEVSGEKHERSVH